MFSFILGGLVLRELVCSGAFGLSKECFGDFGAPSGGGLTKTQSPSRELIALGGRTGRKSSS